MRTCCTARASALMIGKSLDDVVGQLLAFVRDSSRDPDAVADALLALSARSDAGRGQGGRAPATTCTRGSTRTVERRHSVMRAGPGCGRRASRRDHPNAAGTRPATGGSRADRGWRWTTDLSAPHDRADPTARVPIARSEARACRWEAAGGTASRRRAACTVDRLGARQSSRLGASRRPGWAGPLGRRRLQWRGNTFMPRRSAWIVAVLACLAGAALLWGTRDAATTPASRDSEGSERAPMDVPPVRPPTMLAPAPVLSRGNDDGPPGDERGGGTATSGTRTSGSRTPAEGTGLAPDEPGVVALLDSWACRVRAHRGSRALAKGLPTDPSTGGRPDGPDPVRRVHDGTSLADARFDAGPTPLPTSRSRSRGRTSG
jgi:hypothetical protein